MRAEFYRAIIPRSLVVDCFPREEMHLARRPVARLSATPLRSKRAVANDLTIPPCGALRSFKRCGGMIRRRESFRLTRGYLLNPPWLAGIPSKPQRHVS
jgi:hypothetical protein